MGSDELGPPVSLGMVSFRWETQKHFSSAAAQSKKPTAEMPETVRCLFQSYYKQLLCVEKAEITEAFYINQFVKIVQVSVRKYFYDLFLVAPHM